MSLSRRHLLAAGLGAGTLGLLASCGRNSGAPGAASASAGATPRAGGTLRVGALGKASSVTRDPHGLLSNNSDFLIMSMVYDALTVTAAYSRPEARETLAPRLASKWQVSPDARTWEFTIAEGAKFHDEAPVTAQDVVHSLRRIIIDKEQPFKVPVPPDSITALDERRVQLVSAEPNSQLPLLLRLVTFVTRQGSDPESFNGTGPFRLDRYRDGNARLVRFDGWHGERPLLDAIEVLRFDSTDAMSNALQSGQIDLATTAGPITARTLEKDPRFRVTRRPNDSALPIIMRTSDGPFADPRVREAMRLAADRDQLVANVLSGYGSVGNDILGTGDRLYDSTIPQRRRDLDRARQLLDQAGFDRSASYDLFTPDEAYGQVESCRLFAQQAAEVGVRINVVEQDSGTFYDRSWCKAPLTAMVWGTNDSLAFFAQKVMASWSTTNESNWHNDDFDRAYRQLLAATDEAGQRAAAAELQRIQYADSGYLLWGTADGVEVATSQVHDLPSGPGFSWALLERAWLG